MYKYSIELQNKSSFSETIVKNFLKPKRKKDINLKH